MTPSATWRMLSRRSIAVFWIQRNASGSLRPEARLELRLRPVDRLAGLQPVGEVGDLALERGELGVPADRHLDRRHQVVLAEGLDEVRHGARLPGPLDQVALGEGGEHDDRRDARRRRSARRRRCRRGRASSRPGSPGRGAAPRPARRRGRRRRPGRRRRTPPRRASRRGPSGSAPRPRRSPRGAARARSGRRQSHRQANGPRAPRPPGSRPRAPAARGRRGTPPTSAASTRRRAAAVAAARALATACSLLRRAQPPISPIVTSPCSDASLSSNLLDF